MALSVTTGSKATKFTMRGLPLLSSGQDTQPLAVGENLWLHSKVYSRGGENALHAHLAEDHAFFVLQGAVTFSFADGSTSRAERFEGVMIPKGTAYFFEAQGAENLVMIRVGGYADMAAATDHLKNIRDGDGQQIPDNASAQKGRTPAEPIVPIPGRFFDA